MTLVHEVGPAGVVVNTLSPGPVRGERMRRNLAREAQVSATSAEQAEEEVVSRSALRRTVTEGEVRAAAIAMLRVRGLTGADLLHSTSLRHPSLTHAQDGSRCPEHSRAPIACAITGTTGSLASTEQRP